MKSPIAAVCVGLFAIALSLLSGIGTTTASAESASSKPGPATKDEEALSALNLDAPGMEAVKKAAQTGSLDAVKEAYLAYRRTACPTQWTLSAADRPTQATKKSDPLGDEVCEHAIRDTVYGFFKGKKTVDMGKDFDWHHNPLSRSEPDYTTQWTYCVISRMHFWRFLGNAYWNTGDEKYAREWVAQLYDFTAKNNPATHRPGDMFDDSKTTPGLRDATLWLTLDSGIRMADTWPDVYTHFLNSPSFTPDAQWVYLRTICDHIRVLKKGLETPGRYGNWVSTECNGLYTIAVLFPELKDAEALRDFSLNRLVQEANLTVPPDGFEAELTPNYHYLSMAGLVQPLKLAKLNHLTVPDLFRKKLLSMYQAPVIVMDQSGSVMPTNDSGTYNAATYAAKGLQLLGDDPLLLWASSGRTKGQPLSDFTMLPYAGFYAMRGGWQLNDLFLFFRAGPPGIAHEHEDMLEVVFRAWNKTLLFDPGKYSYDQSDMRRFSCGTASHNTIIVDGKWQHRGGNKPPVTQPVNNPFCTTPLFDYVSGRYDGGYQTSVYNPRKQYSPQDWVGEKDFSVCHTRRVLFLKPYYALLIDTLDGTGSHQYDAHFHLDSPAAKLDPKTQAIVSQNAPEQAQLALYPLERSGLEAEVIQGQQEPLLGWLPDEHRAIPTARFRKTQEAPALFATFLYPFKGDQPPCEATPLDTGTDAIWSRALKTERENIEVIVAKDNAPRHWNAQSGLAGPVQAQSAGMVIRRLAQASTTWFGAWGIDAYADSTWHFTADAPATLVWTTQGNHFIVQNADVSRPVQIKVSKPFIQEAILQPGAWMEISNTGVKSAPSPLDELKPLEPPR